MIELLNRYGIEESYHNEIINYINNNDFTDELIEVNVELFSEIIKRGIQFEFTDENVGCVEVSVHYSNESHSVYPVNRILIKEAIDNIVKFSENNSNLIRINKLVSKFGLMYNLDDRYYDTCSFSEFENSDKNLFHNARAEIRLEYQRQ